MEYAWNKIYAELLLREVFMFLFACSRRDFVCELNSSGQIIFNWKCSVFSWTVHVFFIYCSYRCANLLNLTLVILCQFATKNLLLHCRFSSLRYFRTCLHSNLSQFAIGSYFELQFSRKPAQTLNGFQDIKLVVLF